MYKTVEYNKLRAVCLSVDAERQFQELADTVKARSQIVWGEHCTECAFPACYSNCDFYTPRADLHCCRFAEGLVQVSIGEVRAAKIRFRKWANIEGKGPVRLISASRAVRKESVDGLISSLIIRLAPSQTMYARAARLWNIWKDWRSAGYDLAQTSVFIIQAWLGASPSIGVTLTFLPMGESTSNLYQRRFEIREGYNRILIPGEEIAAQVDLKGRFLVQIEPVGDAVGREIIFGLVDFVRFEDGFGANQTVPKPAVKAAPKSEELVKKKRTAKCVVWDLDNTIWHGTLAEDGPEALVLDPMAVSTIIELDLRGILQSIDSKNDPEIALAILENFNLRENVLFPQIGWVPKSDSLKRIAENLDLDLNTFVFIEDQPFERGETIEAPPMVKVLPETEIPRLLGSPLLDVPATAESAKRRTGWRKQK
jgi:HAD superfamily phosphatase (TIGR01681 family)